MIKWKLKCCPRCGGDLFIENNDEGWHAQCLQCSYQHDLEIEMASKRSHRFRGFQPMREPAIVGSH